MIRGAGAGGHIKKQSIESRVDEVEAKVSLADDLLDALNRTIYLQQQQIEQLQQQVRALQTQLRESLPAESGRLMDEVPPHY
jgi:SlyX protein